MKLLLDENLSPEVAPALADLFPGTAHARDCGLLKARDRTVWEYAVNRGFALVSTDSDFNELSALRGVPPKVVWLQAGNRTTTELVSILRSSAEAIGEFINHPESRCLIVRRRSPGRTGGSSG
jgi:predicted nuclease of predicted toxin-antitoxin system